MGHIPTATDLIAVHHQFSLQYPIADAIPQEVSMILDRFVNRCNLIITMESAKDIYTRLRNYLDSNM